MICLVNHHTRSSSWPLAFHFYSIFFCSCYFFLLNNNGENHHRYDSKNFNRFLSIINASFFYLILNDQVKCTKRGVFISSLFKILNHVYIRDTRIWFWLIDPIMPIEFFDLDMTFRRSLTYLPILSYNCYFTLFVSTYLYYSVFKVFPSFSVGVTFQVWLKIIK